MAFGLNYQPEEKAPEPRKPSVKAEPKPEPKLRNKINRLTLGALIVVSAIYIAIYVGNVLKVNSLVKEQQRVKERNRLVGGLFAKFESKNSKSSIRR